MFNKDINYLLRTPLCLFEIKNFVSDYLYDGLNENFPTIDDLNLGDYDIYENKKYAFTVDSQIYNQLMEKNKYMAEFHKIVFSKDFFNFFYSKFYLEFLKSRLKNFKHLAKLLKYPKAVDLIDKNKISYYFSFFNQIKIDIQYSYIFNKGKIVPHTDSGEKTLKSHALFSFFK